MRRIFLLLMSLFLLSPFYSRSQWNPCIGIEGGNVRDIIYHDTSLYIIVVYAGVFKKGISEPSWSENILQGSFEWIRSTDTALFCSDLHGLYRSLDHGATWDQPVMETILFDFETCNNAVFIVTDQEIVRSSDQGETWTDVNPFPGYQIFGHFLHANDEWIVCISHYTDSLSLSNDNGENWTYLPLMDSVWSTADAFVTDNGIWLAYRATNGEKTDRVGYYDLEHSSWSVMEDSIPPGTTVTNFFIRDEVLRCATALGIYHFDPQDSLWISDNNQGLENKYVLSACVIGDSTWVATPSGPFFNPGNSDWYADYHHLYQREVSQVFRQGSRLYAVSDDKIYYSDSIEAGFEVLNTPGLYDLYEVEPGDSLWCAGSSAGFLISGDSGATWVSHSNGIEGRRVNHIALTSEYYFCAAYGLFRTLRDSISWERVPNEIGTSNILHLNSLDDIVFASIDDAGEAGLYRSADQGNTFQHVPESGSSPPNLHAEAQDFYMLLHGDGPILSTSGECILWDTCISDFLFDCLLNCMDVSDSGSSTIVGGGFMGGSEYYLEYFSDPLNEEGIDITDNLPFSSIAVIRSIFNDNGRLFVAPTDNSLYYRDDFMVNVEEDPADELIGGDGIRIYPNPASGRITIEFSAIKDILYVKVFDSRGRQLLQREMTGHHLDLSGLKAGLYILEITSGNSTARKKIVMR